MAEIRKPVPESKGAEASLRILQAELDTVCGVKSGFPHHEDPEYAFAGKSNVGKSSLINALMQRKSLARTSSTPGKTQTVNFYRVRTRGDGGDRAMYLVDLPGYGYTKASVTSRASWGRMVERYLHDTKMLKRIFLLVDMRHKPTEDDCMMHEWILDRGFTPVVVATKADKLKKNERPKALKLIRETLELSPEDLLIPFSSETGEGRETIYQLLQGT